MSSDKSELPAVDDPVQTTKLLERKWLSAKAFEITLSRPSPFVFKAGHTIRFVSGDLERYYSLTSGPDEPVLSLCVRFVEEGPFSTVLATSEPGTPFHFTGPHGYFVFQPSARPAVFVATGTGIAPFVSMTISGVTDFTLLHGVSDIKDLYYRDHFQRFTERYIPCLSEAPVELMQPHTFFLGRVTDYITQKLAQMPYDFYLCGRREMVRDVTHLVDERFPGSFIYTEVFF